MVSEVASFRLKAVPKLDLGRLQMIQGVEGVISNAFCSKQPRSGPCAAVSVTVSLHNGVIVHIMPAATKPALFDCSVLDQDGEDYLHKELSSDEAIHLISQLARRRPRASSRTSASALALTQEP